MCFKLYLIVLIFCLVQLKAASPDRQWQGGQVAPREGSDRSIHFDHDFRSGFDWVNKFMQDRPYKIGHNRGPFIEPLDKPDTDLDMEPSVVIVDKGESPQSSVPSIESAFNFPFPMSFDRPKLWPFPSSLFSQQKPWWKGPNVCIERRVIEAKEVNNNTKAEPMDPEDSLLFGASDDQNFHRLFSFQSTHCTESDTSYTCVSKIIRGRENRTTIVKHQCCHGFKRVANMYCTQVDLKDLVQTMKDLKSNRMLRLIEKLGLSQKLASDNLTVMAVTDDSLIEFEDDNSKVENEIETDQSGIPTPVRRRRQIDHKISEVIPMHIIPGFWRTDDFNDQLIESSSPSKRVIRFNVYNNPKRVVTANCAPIVSANNYATNGIVHILDRVMPIANQTIGQIIEKDPRFSILNSLLVKTGLITKLKEESQSLTFFAPTNDAFLKLEQLYLERLLNGQSCVEPLLLNHLTKSTLCLSAIQEIASIKNEIDVFLAIKKVDDKLEVDGHRVLESDKLATNGVIQVIDGVMISEKSQPISRYLEKHQMTQYLDFLKESGLLNEWEGLQNVSFFVPSVDAMKSMTEVRLREIQNNTKDAISYHVVTPQTKPLLWNGEQKLRAMDGSEVRVNTFGDMTGFGLKPTITAQCGKIVAQNQICGANVHVVDKFISRAKGNLTQVLKSVDKFSLLTRIIEKSEIENKLSEGMYTLLAPTDQSLTNDLSEYEIDVLLKNKSSADKFIRSYLMPEVICCSGVDTSPLIFSSQQIRAMDGSLITAHKSFNGRIRFGNARATQCDLMATNGVIHAINRVLETKPLVHNLPFNFEIIF